MLDHCAEMKCTVLGVVGSNPNIYCSAPSLGGVVSNVIVSLSGHQHFSISLC